MGTPGGPGTVLVADFQRAGRGRRGRSWVAPPGSALLVTAILPQAIAVTALWAVPLWTALAVADGIEAAAGVRVSLQWPNDLLAAGRKCCGILCVSRVAGLDAWVGCGTGIDVHRPAGDAALAAIVPPPAFLSDFAPQVERRAVLDAVLAAYAARLPELDDPRGVARAWERRASLAGTRYRLSVDGEPAPFDATALRLDDDGSLVVLAAEGERHVSLADARVLRD